MLTARMRLNKKGTANLLLTFDQRRVLEALRDLGRCTITEIKHEADISRALLREIVIELTKREFIKKIEFSDAPAPGRAGLFEWTGKKFRPSAELNPSRFRLDDLVSPSPEIAVLIESINAMVQIGRSAA